MLRPIYIALALLLVVTLASCRRIALYDDEANLFLSIDIDLDIENAGDIDEPEIMLVGFYDIDTHEYYSHDYIGPKGGLVNVDPGDYDIIVYNYDTEYTQLRNEHHLHELEAYTNPVPYDVRVRYSQMKKAIKQYKLSRGDGNPTDLVGDYTDQELSNQPDHLFVGLLKNQNVPQRLDENDVCHLLVDVSSVVETYALEVRGITGMEYIMSVDAYITGQSGAVAIGKREHAGDATTIYVPLVASARSAVLTTTFNTFGKRADKSAYVVLQVIDTGGNEHLYEYDVTGQFDDPANIHKQIVIDSHIKIEQPTVEGGGMVPSVTIWNEEETIINF